MNNKNLNLYTKETSIILNNWFVMYFLSVILIGTVYPIFLEVLSNEKISVGPPFFNKLIIPFLIPFLIFMSIGPNLKWIKNNYFSKKIKIDNYINFEHYFINTSLEIFWKYRIKYNNIISCKLLSFYYYYQRFN